MLKMAIIGRPNVGKSALFNRICNQRLAIVDAAEGVTRDRLYATTSHFGFCFQVVDTGGIDPQSADQFQREIAEQAHIAIQEADTLVMVVDGHAGITPLDATLASFLLKQQKPLTLAVNKIDHAEQLGKLHEFYGLGISKLIAVSANQGYQIAELVELAWQDATSLPEPLEVTQKKEVIKVAIVGRPNVGKSTLINGLLEQPRCIVSEIPGTTRDYIEIPLTWQGRDFILLDTAGVRRKKSEPEAVDKFAAIRTTQAIEKADVVVLVLDVQEGLTTQEKRLAQQIAESGKGAVLVLNKWDLARHRSAIQANSSGFRMEHSLRALGDQIPFLAHAPRICLSAKERRHLKHLLPEVKRVYMALQTRIPTHKLNCFLERAMQLNHPPLLTGKRLKIYYMTQVAVHPPQFVLFVNHPSLMAATYKKYLINSFRKEFTLTGAPLQLHIRGKEREKESE